MKPESHFLGSHFQLLKYSSRLETITQIGSVVSHRSITALHLEAVVASEEPGQQVDVVTTDLPFCLVESAESITSPLYPETLECIPFFFHHHEFCTEINTPLINRRWIIMGTRQDRLARGDLFRQQFGKLGQCS
jgi:hypothetical protein